MVIKTYFKTLFRMFKRHVTRLVSLIFIVLISVGFISGIGSSSDKIDFSMTDYYKANNVSDFIIRDTTGNGFSDEDVAAVKELFPQASVDTGTSLDVSVGEKRSLRIYFLDFEKWTVNLPDFIEGGKPADKTQGCAELADNVIKGYAVGDTVELDFGAILLKMSQQYGYELDALSKALLGKLEPVTVTISGIVQSPLTFALDGEPSDNNPADTVIPDTVTGVGDLDCLENILYLSKDLIPKMKDLSLILGGNEPLLKTGYIAVAVSDRNKFNAMSSAYESYVKEQAEKITALLDDVKVLTLYDNFSFKSLKAYGEKVAGIGYILMAAFLLVTALVVLSTMTRLIDEERSQVACLKTLGYSSAGIISKYLLFALIATGIGGFGSYFVGLGITRLIYIVFNYSFRMPPISSSVAIVYFVITLTVIVVATLFATALSGLRMANDRPANLLRPKPPKSGKKVILEKIPILWNRLSFKYKSTVRNVLRYKSRFVMTVVAVAFSTALVLTGLALLDLCLFHDFGSLSIMGIAIIVVAFAGLLTAIVIYTLTNINISERNREIATLMVLGYYDQEVSGYIYREIYINSIIGILFGYPVSLLLMGMLFNIIGLGTIGGVSWFMWLVAPIVVLLFTGLVTLILRRKIVGVDMNESLKAIE